MTAPSPPRDGVESVLERLRKAEGPSRELDLLLLTRFGGWCDVFDDGAQVDSPDGWSFFRESDDEGRRAYPSPTASIDAALALTERVLPGWLTDLTEHHDPDAAVGRYFSAQLFRPRTLGSVSAEHSTRPLAVCIATLTALTKANPHD